MKRYVIVTGGVLDIDFAGSFLAKNKDFKVIAVDAGLEKCHQMGRIPDAVVGDFDTVDQTILKQYQRRSDILWDIHQPEKDETDTELALQTAFRLAADEIILLGAMGGRMDHMLSNLQLLYLCLEKGIDAWMADCQNKLYLISQSAEFYADSIWGRYISFLPFSDRIEGLTLNGFRYPLTNKNLEKGIDGGLCISNELIANRGLLEVKRGILICVESKD